MKTILSALGLSLLILTSCGGQKKVEVDFIQDISLNKSNWYRRFWMPDTPMKAKAPFTSM